MRSGLPHSTHSPHSTKSTQSVQPTQSPQLAQLDSLVQNQHKICLDFASATKLAEQHRKKKQKIVLTQGTFDMIHVGHARYCAKAKEYGDVLFVAVDSDAKVRARKGPERPVVPQEERLEMLTYFASVDHVVLKPLEESKWSLIKKLKPDVLIVTRENYNKQQLKELEKLCGKVVVLEPMATTSTSAKIRLVQLGAAQKISATITKKLINSVEEILEELKGGA